MTHDYMSKFNLPKSEVLANAVDSLLEPVQHFLDHGFFYQTARWFDNEKGLISYPQPRRVCRQLAKEQKRPFVCTEMSLTYEYDRDKHHFIRGNPMFHSVTVTIPKRQYLSILAAPLIVGEGSAEIRLFAKESIWMFRINSKSVAEEYLTFLRTDPDVRRALRMPPRR